MNKSQIIAEILKFNLGQSEEFQLGSTISESVSAGSGAGNLVNTIQEITSGFDGLDETERDEVVEAVKSNVVIILSDDD